MYANRRMITRVGTVATMHQAFLAPGPGALNALDIGIPRVPGGHRRASLSIGLAASA